MNCKVKIQKPLIVVGLALAYFACGDDSPVAPHQQPVAPQFGAVSGTITDARTGNPIPHATVTLLTQTTKVGVNGKYIFSQITYLDALSLTVEAADYATQTPTFALNTKSLVIDISLEPLTNPELEIRQFLNTLSELVGSKDGNNVEAIQAHFSQSYLAGADPVTRFFGLPTGVVPSNHEQVIPWILKLFETYSTIEFDFYGVMVEVTHTQKASAQMNFDVITEKGVQSDRQKIISECEIFFRKEASHWKVIFWHFSKFDIYL